MTGEQTGSGPESGSASGSESEKTVPPNRLIERSPIIVGAVGAAIALITLIGLPLQFYVIAQSALAWLSMALAVLGLSTIARGRQNAGSIVALVIGLGAFAFWTIAPESLGDLPIYAYIVTALVHVGLGLLIGRVDMARQRSVYIACAGAVVFTIVTSFSRLGI